MGYVVTVVFEVHPVVKERDQWGTVKVRSFGGAG